MARIRSLNPGEDKKGALYTHAIEDGRGNVAYGHFDASFVPSFIPGTRISDIAFLVDEVVAQEAPNQSEQAILQQLRGPVA